MVSVAASVQLNRKFKISVFSREKPKKKTFGFRFAPLPQLIVHFDYFVILCTHYKISYVPGKYYYQAIMSIHILLLLSKRLRSVRLYDRTLFQTCTYATFSLCMSIYRPLGATRSSSGHQPAAAQPTCSGITCVRVVPINYVKWYDMHSIIFRPSRDGRGCDQLTNPPPPRLYGPVV